ncbi:MAG TPA: glycosyltransferase N-terminal domain-containing protein [Chlamydiales bacterium]|jgi:3-deoxy-D-manno-octulosonic-acid transferase|nr:glycosyltransferase N-terminal domain-containing protein [Chlamydiales bacterium]
MIYNCLLALGFLAFLPKILWESRKKQFPTFKERLGVDFPDPKGRAVLWIHAVSVGEVKAAKPLFEKIRAESPRAFILVTTASVTGQEEAKRSLSQADAFRFLPLDFSWIVKRWVRALQPKVLLFSESDCWYNLAKQVSKAGGKVALISGKISERSTKRYRWVPWFAKKLFSCFDLLLLQNEEYLTRFQSIIDTPEKLSITGNLKFDAAPIAIDKTCYSLPLGIAITCTHAPEEEEILDALEGIDLPIFLAPRHPERFQEVAHLLEQKNIAYVRWSEREKKGGGERVILIDGMGLLPIIYTFSKLAIVAGSFSSCIGGHNILEPCLYGVPVFFGPHMHQQTELRDRLLASGAGVQTTLSDLPGAIQQFLASPTAQKAAVQKLLIQTQGPLQKTWEKLQPFFKIACV